MRIGFLRTQDLYLRTNGQIYWSDTHQPSYNPEGYHRSLDSTMRVGVPGSEMISELYVPRKELASFFADMREDFRTMSKRFTARSA